MLNILDPNYVHDIYIFLILIIFMKYIYIFWIPITSMIYIYIFLILIMFMKYIVLILMMSISRMTTLMSFTRSST